MHKTLFPMTFAEILGSGIIGIAVGFANAGGIGGGPVMVPLVLFFFNYPLKQCIMISFLLVCGGALGNFLKFSSLRNSSSGGPIVNYDLVILSLPLLSIGSEFGVMFNYLLPESVLCLVLVLVCLQALARTYDRYQKQLRLEKQEKEKQLERGELASDCTSLKTHGHYAKYSSEDQEQLVASDISQKEQIELIPDKLTRDLYLSELELYPRKKILVLCLFLLLTLVMTMLKGGKKVPSLIGIKYCQSEYWILTLLFLLSSYLFVQKYIETVIRKRLLFDQLKTLPQINPIELTASRVYELSKCALMAGWLGGMLGLGGGIVLTPIWLSMGFQTQEVTVTSILAVLFSSFVSTVCAVMSGNLEKDMLLFFLVSFLSSMTVATILKRVIAKTKRESILLLILQAKIVISMAALPLLTIIKYVHTKNEIFLFKSLC